MGFKPILRQLQPRCKELREVGGSQPSHRIPPMRCVEAGSPTTGVVAYGYVVEESSEPSRVDGRIDEADGRLANRQAGVVNHGEHGAAHW